MRRCKVSETINRLEWKGRQMVSRSTVYSAPDATEDSLMKIIFEKLDEMSKHIDRLEELERTGRWARRRRRIRKNLRCHRCQRLNHIARNCWVTAPIPAGAGRGSSAVERATPGEEVPGSIPAVAARSLQVGSVSV